MAKDWQIKKRRPVRRKHIAPLLKDLEEALGIDLAVDGAFLEMADYGPWKMVLVDRVPLAVELMNPDDERVVFLTLRGFLAHPCEKRFVEVDHGAIPFLMKGADCMVAGIHNADSEIREGDLVWVRDQQHKRPLAIGWATKDGNSLVEELKGKGLKNIHWVGDELWEMEL
ncbi:MAG: RNA-binding protein [Candidatus Poseidoniales archaeon]|nr:RNA-binding protein [Candidatus Poseidoniales archaeon]